jgi:NADH dehydrogenase FAD-containing subunit
MHVCRSTRDIAYRLDSLQTTRDCNVFAIGDCATRQPAHRVQCRRGRNRRMSNLRIMARQIERWLRGQPLQPYTTAISARWFRSENGARSET